MLDNLGISDDGRVATFAWNTARHLELYFAAPCTGRVLHTLNIRLFPEQLTYIVNHADDDVIFVDRSLLGLLAPLLPTFENLKHLVMMDDGKGDIPADLNGHELLDNAGGLAHAAVATGADLILRCPDLSGPAVATLIVDEKVTVAAGVPTIWMAVLLELAGKDTSSLRSIPCGGSAVPKSLSEAYREQTGPPIFQAWGMTESAGGSPTRLRREGTRRGSHRGRGAHVPRGQDRRVPDAQGRDLDRRGPQDQRRQVLEEDLARQARQCPDELTSGTTRV